jgi:hypothetical protein
MHQLIHIWLLLQKTYAMLLRTFLPLLLLAHTLSSLHAQVQEAYLLPGSGGSAGIIGTRDDFVKLAPNASMLQRDVAGFNNTSSGGFYGSGAFSFGVGMALGDAERERELKPVLRLGFMYQSGSSMAYSLSRETRFTFDTLTSGTTGHMVFRDSLRNERYYYKYYSEQIRLDASLLYRWNEEGRWSLYGGAGLALGVSLNSRTQLQYTDQWSTLLRMPANAVSNLWFNDDSWQMETETVRNKSNLSAMLYVPVGVDFRIGKNRPFWQKLHLFYEFRPGVHVLSVPELGTFSRAGIIQGLGFRLKWA